MASKHVPWSSTTPPQLGVRWGFRPNIFVYIPAVKQDPRFHFLCLVVSGRSALALGPLDSSCFPKLCLHDRARQAKLMPNSPRLINPLTPLWQLRVLKYPPVSRIRMWRRTLRWWNGLLNIHPRQKKHGASSWGSSLLLIGLADIIGCGLLGM